MVEQTRELASPASGDWLPFRFVGRLSSVTFVTCAGAAIPSGEPTVLADVDGVVVGFLGLAEQRVHAHVVIEELGVGGHITSLQVARGGQIAVPSTGLGP